MSWPQLLPGLREQAGLTVRGLADRIVEAFALRPADASRAEHYLARMERGELEPAQVSRRLYDVLGQALGVPADRLRSAGGPGLVTPAPVYRAEGEVADWVAEDVTAIAAAARAPAPSHAADEIDLLFTGGPQG